MNRTTTDDWDPGLTGRHEPLRGRIARRSFARSMPAFAAVAVLVSFLPARAQSMKPEVEARVKNATVLVKMAEWNGGKCDKDLGAGSGFFVNSTGVAVTNNHVVDPFHGKSAQEKHMGHYGKNKLCYKVVLNSGTESATEKRAQVLYQNEAADQAVLQVFEDQEMTETYESPDYLLLQPESRLAKRLKVWAFGFPGGDQQKGSRSSEHAEMSITEGHILEFPRTPGGRLRMVYTDVIARPGNSGGPMVDQDGYLIGTVTLMLPPEGREDTGGANYSSLGPAALTAGMIRNACILGKMTPGADLVPFVDALTNDDGRLVVPEYKRLPERDVLYYEGGDRIYGRITTDTILWNCALGEIEVPLEAVAYVITNDTGSHLLLEGGNRISAKGIESKFAFEMDGGVSGEQRFSDVRVVGFRMADRHLTPVTGQALVLDTEVCHLVLANVEGAVKFQFHGFTKSVPVDEILRFDRDAAGKYVLSLRNRERYTGAFEESPVEGVVAATNTPIRFDLSKVQRASFDLVEHDRHGVAGLGLTAVLASAGDEIRKMVADLDAGKVKEVREALDAMVTRDHLRSLPKSEQEQVLLLDAVVRLRAGEADEAGKAFRKCAGADDRNIQAYALACGDVLKNYSDFKFQGNPLSDRAVFIAAGEALAAGRIREVRDLLKDASLMEGGSRGDYVKSIAAVRKREGDMIASALFAGAEADDELARLWKYAINSCYGEMARIQQEIEAQKEAGRSYSSGARLAMDRKLEDLNEDLAKVQETLAEFTVKRRADVSGFRIEDPDIQSLKDR